MASSPSLKWLPWSRPHIGPLQQPPLQASPEADDFVFHDSPLASFESHTCLIYGAPADVMFPSVPVATDVGLTRDHDDTEEDERKLVKAIRIGHSSSSTSSFGYYAGDNAYTSRPWFAAAPDLGAIRCPTVTASPSHPFPPQGTPSEHSSRPSSQEVQDDKDEDMENLVAFVRMQRSYSSSSSFGCYVDPPTPATPASWNTHTRRTSLRGAGLDAGPRVRTPLCCATRTPCSTGSGEQFAQSAHTSIVSVDCGEPSSSSTSSHRRADLIPRCACVDYSSQRDCSISTANGSSSASSAGSASFSSTTHTSVTTSSSDPDHLVDDAMVGARSVASPGTPTTGWFARFKLRWSRRTKPHS
ncbi:hypothetical protein C8Q76DRAFT_762848 [Earliella scabrosa]|nr:hypothetical protein C8Q76DRAFT_762848 [Earliella scabrosa]